MGAVKSLFGRRPKGPSAAEIAERERKSREAERARIEQERLAAEAEAKRKAKAAIDEKAAQRRAFAGQLSEQPDSGSRKRFLKAV